MKNLEQNNAQNSSLERIKQYQKHRQDKRDINAMIATGITSLIPLSILAYEIAPYYMQRKIDTALEQIFRNIFL